MIELNGYRIKTMPIIPLVYDDSLSYLEMVAKVMKKTNDLIELTNELVDISANHEGRIHALEEDFTNLRDEFVAFKALIETEFAELEQELNDKIDAKIAEFEVEINNKIAELTQAVNKLIAETNARIDALEQSVDARITALEQEMRQDFAELTARIINELNGLKQEVYDAIEEMRQAVILQNEIMKAWVENRLADFLANLPDYTTILVVSPVSGKLMTVQDALNELYDYGIRVKGLTALEYDALGLTADDYDALELTAFEYDMYGSEKIFNLKDPRLYMFSPFNGEYVTVKEVVMGLATLHRLDGAVYTATEYDNLALTATYYDNEQIDAYDYDWNGKNILAPI